MKRTWRTADGNENRFSLNETSNRFLRILAAMPAASDYLEIDVTSACRYLAPGVKRCLSQSVLGACQNRDCATVPLPACVTTLSNHKSSKPPRNIQQNREHLCLRHLILARLYFQQFQPQNATIIDGCLLLLLLLLDCSMSKAIGFWLRTCSR